MEDSQTPFSFEAAQWALRDKSEADLRQAVWEIFWDVPESRAQILHDLPTAEAKVLFALGEDDFEQFKARRGISENEDAIDEIAAVVKLDDLFAPDIARLIVAGVITLAGKAAA